MNRQIVKLGLVSLFAMSWGSGAMAQADNSNSKVAPATSFTSWMSTQSTSNQGRISRDAYMQESGRRWDAMDTERRGLTTDQVNSMYGFSAGLPDNKDGIARPSSPENVTK